MINIYKIQVDNLSFIGLVTNFFFTPHYFGSLKNPQTSTFYLEHFKNGFQYIVYPIPKHLKAKI